MSTFDVRTELQLAGVWTNITADTFQEDGVTITRGRSDEASTVEPSTCNVTIDNRTGNYSPRNPMGSHFAVLGRNTPMRIISPTSAQNYLAVSGRYDAYASTPDAASLDIVGDIDVRVDVDPETWRPAGYQSLVGKVWNSAADELASGNTDSFSWELRTTPTGYLSFRWSDDGFLNHYEALSTIPVPATTGRLAVKAVLDVNNGAAGRTITFSTAPTLGGSYTTFGAAVVQAGVTSIFAGTGRLIVGGGWPYQGKVYGAEVRNSAAALVASPDFTSRDSGDTAFTDAQSRPWTLVGQSVMANPDARFHGEVSSWPAKWDKTERDVRTPVTGSGVLRRLGQGQPPLRSVMYRALSSSPTMRAYWPCEDGDGATELASAMPGKPPMTFNGDIDTASFSDFKASDPLPTASNHQWVGAVPKYTPTDQTQIRFLLHIPPGGVGGGAGVWTEVMRFRAYGTAPLWKLSVSDLGSWRVQAYDSDDAQIHDSGALLLTSANGQLLRVSLRVNGFGTGLVWYLDTLEVGTENGLQAQGNVANRTVGSVRRIAMNTAGTMGDVAIGHIILQTESTSIFELSTEMTGYVGETAATRILRICGEEGMPVTLTGVPEASTPMGAQTSGTLLAILRECEDADMGILYEPREFLGLAYRTRSSMYAQEPAVTLDYSAGTVSEIEPTEDDQETRNDLTLTRIDGSSTHAELTTGPLSVLPPPLGVGRYDTETSVSLRRDEDLPNQAAWRLRLGTVDEPRYPVLGVDLALRAFRNSAVLTAAMLALDLGGRVVVTNGKLETMGPDNVQQLAQGFTETLSPYQWGIGVNCSPGSPWDVAVWDDDAGVGEARYSSDGTTITEDLTTTETGIDVSTPTGPVWSDAQGDFDIMIGGERMRVTSILGVSAAQVFTVTRSVNGIVKTHASGAPVVLFKQGRYAL